jgi:hypothetical protein
MRAQPLAVLVVTAALAASAPPAQATLVRGFSLAALTLEAHDVVRGVVVDQSSFYDPSRDRIYTDSVIAVAEALGGAQRAGELVVVRQMGGIVDGLQHRVVGTAPLALGAEVVVFTRTDGAIHYLVGMAQGAYGVARPAAGPATVTRGLAGLTLTPPAAIARPRAPDRLTLAQLRAAVIATLRDAGRLP